MKRALFVVLILSLSVLTACNAVSLEEAEAQFCEDLSAFRTALSAYAALDENSTLDQAAQAAALVADTYDDLAWSAQTLREVQVAQLDEEFDALQQTIRDLEGEETVGEASTEIDAALAEIDAAAEELHSTICR